MSKELDPEETPQSRLRKKHATEDLAHKKAREQFPDEVRYEQRGTKIVKLTKVFGPDANGKPIVLKEYSVLYLARTKSNKEAWESALQKCKKG